MFDAEWRRRMSQNGIIESQNGIIESQKGIINATQRNATQRNAICVAFAFI